MIPAIRKDAGRALLERCRRGDLDAWEKLLEQYHDDVTQFLYLLDPILTREAVRDLAGEVFARAVSTIESALEERVSPRVWLMRLAAQCLRARQERNADFASSPDDEPVLLRRLLDRVGGPCRDILELAFFGGLDTRELATALEIESETVDTRIEMCLNRLEVFVQQDPSGEFRALHQE